MIVSKIDTQYIESFFPTGSFLTVTRDDMRSITEFVISDNNADVIADCVITDELAENLGRARAVVTIIEQLQYTRN